VKVAVFSVMFGTPVGQKPGSISWFHY